MIPIEDIEQLKRLRMIEWFPVSKRYHNDDELGPFLITSSNGIVYGDITYDYKYGYKEDRVQIFHRWDNEMYQCFEPDVIAWANYPKPYKGDE